LFGVLLGKCWGTERSLVSAAPLLHSVIFCYIRKDSATDLIMQQKVFSEDSFKLGSLPPWCLKHCEVCGLKTLVFK
jgi:hypothetical protein